MTRKQFVLSCAALAVAAGTAIAVAQPDGVASLIPKARAGADAPLRCTWETGMQYGGLWPQDGMNVGTFSCSVTVAALTVIDVVLNRGHCGPFFGLTKFDGPKTYKFGEQVRVLYNGECRLIEAAVILDDGHTWTVTWGADR